jgi:hypothetical protein
MSQRTAHDVLNERAPKLYPYGYSEERAWEEYDGKRFAALADLIDAHEPKHADDYSRSDAFIGFEQLLTRAAEQVEEWRMRKHYRSYITDAADEIARETLEEYPDETDAEELMQAADYDGGITERVDSAVPIYYSTIDLVFEENDLDVDDGEVKALAGEDADMAKLKQVAIYEAIYGEERANRDRIVACVNACKGIAYPEIDVPTMIDALDIVQRAWSGDGVNMAEAVDRCLVVLARIDTEGSAS